MRIGFLCLIMKAHHAIIKMVLQTQTVSGAHCLAHHHESDFALLKLEETPPEEYNIYFSGWDISGNNPFNCTTIHHPVGDIKKISQHSGVAISDGWFFDDETHWKINEWQSGIANPVLMVLLCLIKTNKL